MDPHEFKLTCPFAPATRQDQGEETEPSPQKIGIIRLDYDWQKLRGDIDEASTYHTMGFDVVWAKVEGFTFVNAQQGMKDGKFRDSFMTHEECAAFDALDPSFRRDPSKSVRTEKGLSYSGESIQTSMLAAIRELESKGVSYITGNCGFMMNFQEFVSANTEKPVMMSALMQLPMLVRSLGRGEPLRQVVVLTANSESLHAAWDSMFPSQWNIPKDQIIVVGCQEVSGFGKQVAEGLQHNPTLAAPALCNVVMKHISDEGDRASAILLECTELPLYVQPLRNVTRLPVYDVVTMIQFAHIGVAGASSRGGPAGETISRRVSDQTQWVDVSRERPTLKPKIGMLLLDNWFGDGCPFCNDHFFQASAHSSLHFEMVYKRMQGVTRDDCMGGLADGTVAWPSEVPEGLRNVAASYPKLATLLDFASDLQSEKYEDTIYQPMQPWDWPVVKACNFLGLQYSTFSATTPHLLVRRRSVPRKTVDAKGFSVFAYTKAYKLESIKQALKELKQAGVIGIVGQTGEMRSLQPLIASLTDVPVILSPLAQLAFMTIALARHRKVVICTTHPMGEWDSTKPAGTDFSLSETFIKSLAPATAADRWEQVRVLSVFDSFKGEDTQQGALKAFIRMIKEDASRHGYVLGAILLFNAEMALYKEGLLKEFCVPVRDLTSVLTFLRIGHVTSCYSE